MGQKIAGNEPCSAMPVFNDSWVQSDEGRQGGDHSCVAYDYVCLDQGMFVMHDPKYNAINGTKLPSFEIGSSFQGEWAGPDKIDKSGALPVNQILFAPPVFRPPVRGDPEPVFSDCTLPVIFYKEYAYNYAHSMLTILPQIYHWFQHRAVNEYVTYVLVTYWGAKFPEFLHPVFKPFTMYEPTSLADFSSRLPTNASSTSTAEGQHVRCFRKVALCRLVDFLGSFPQQAKGPASEFLYDWYNRRGLLPENPADFPAREEGDVGPRRVLIENREGPVRTMENMAEILQHCNVPDSPWACRNYTTGLNFERDLAALRSADVFVFIHGAAGANLIFMRNDTAVIEITPLDFAGQFDSNWQTVFFPQLTANIEYRVWYFHINIGDPNLSRAGQWESLGVGAPHFYARDRHVTLPWTALQSVLMKIDALQGRKDDFLALQKAGENLVEVRPNGVLQRSPQKTEWFAIARLKDFEGLGPRPPILVEEWRASLKNGDSEAAALKQKEAVSILERLRQGMQDAERGLNETASQGRVINSTLLEEVTLARGKIAEIENEVLSIFQTANSTTNSSSGATQDVPLAECRQEGTPNSKTRRSWWRLSGSRSKSNCSVGH
eukprot:jgi/Botrbrau1/4479/Bobra.0220s0013.1